MHLDNLAFPAGKSSQHPLRSEKNFFILFFYKFFPKLLRLPEAPGLKYPAATVYYPLSFQNKSESVIRDPALLRLEFR